jgi:hypothetical protein
MYAFQASTFGGWARWRKFSVLCGIHSDEDGQAWKEAGLAKFYVGL